MKEMVLDPPLPWAEDDRFTIKRMRLISLVFITSVTSLLFAYEGYPKVYYSMIGTKKPITELPIGTFAFAMSQCVLVVTYIVTSLAAVFYERRSTLVNNTTIPSGVKHLASALTFFLGLILAYGVIFEFLGDGDIWIVLLLYQIVFGVFSPLNTISTSSQLKDYVKGAFLAFILFVSDFYEKFCSRRSPHVSLI